MSRETKVASIPEIRDDNVREVLQAIKNTMLVREGNIGDPLDQVATLRDLVALNVAEEANDGGGTPAGNGVLPINPLLPPPIDGYNPATDYTTPPAPTGLRAFGGFTNVYLEWEGAPYRNHNYTEVWRSTTDNLGTAVLIGTTAASVYADPAQPNTTYYYWIRFVSRAAVTGPYNQTSGTSATTALDVNAAISAISEEIVNSQLFADLGSRITNATNGINEVRSIAATAVSQTQTLTNQVGSNTASIQTQSRVTDGLNAQYTVKIDNNGYVSGFGLASTSVNGVPRSSFQVRADSFAIAPASAPGWEFSSVYDKNSVVNYTVDGVTRQYQSLVSGNYNLTPPTNPGFWVDITAKLPFVVLTAATTINGTTYPAGTYINTAFIADATIVSAKIKDLVADKIVTGTLTAAIGITTGKIYGGVNTSYPIGSFNYGKGFFLGDDGGVYKFFVGDPTEYMLWNGSNLAIKGQLTATSGSFYNITIYDNQGRILLSSGSGVNTALLGLKALAFQDTVNINQVPGLGTLATQNSVFLNSNVRFPDGSVMNTGDFVNRLSQIGPGNISTFIERGAIGEAYIGNLNAAKITAGTIAADRLDSAIITAKIANLDAARIKEASIDTLRLAGEAVTVTRSMSAGVVETNYTWTEKERIISSIDITVPDLGLDANRRYIRQRFAVTGLQNIYPVPGVTGQPNVSWILRISVVNNNDNTWPFWSAGTTYSAGALVRYTVDGGVTKLFRSKISGNVGIEPWVRTAWDDTNARAEAGVTVSNGGTFTGTMAYEELEPGSYKFCFGSFLSQPGGDARIGLHTQLNAILQSAKR